MAANVCNTHEGGENREVWGLALEDDIEAPYNITRVIREPRTLNPPSPGWGSSKAGIEGSRCCEHWEDPARSSPFSRESYSEDLGFRV